MRWIKVAKTKRTKRGEGGKGKNLSRCDEIWSRAVGGGFPGSVHCSRRRGRVALLASGRVVALASGQGNKDKSRCWVTGSFQIDINFDCLSCGAVLLLLVLLLLLLLKRTATRTHVQVPLLRGWKQLRC
jgi:hypothetical protein